LAECFKAHLPQSDGKKIDLNAMRKPKAMPKVIPEHGGEDCAGRNSEMFIEACKLFRDDKSLEEVRGILSVLNARCVPPLDAEEIAKLATNAEKSVEEQRAGQVNGAAKIEERCTDIANAEGFVGMFGEQFCYVPEKSALTVWDGERWNIGENAAHAVKTLAMDYAKTKFDEAKNAPEHERARLGKHAIYSNNSRGVESFLRLVPGVRGVAVSIQKFDSAPDSLNVLNGTIDLRTGELKPHRRKDCHTKLAQAVYDPDAKAPRWESFLTEIFKGDAELVSYMQRAIGYSLTGRTREEVFFLLYGDGRNGKGTMVETLQAMLGDYADTVAPEVLLQKNESGGNTPELAKLKSIRFAPSSETDTKRKLAEALVKRITGGDLITACAKYGHPFTYKPEFKLWLATNKKPTITGTDLGIWSRIKMIPFLQKFEGKAKDAKLKETLRAEMLGILAWAVRGAVAWYQQGLGSCAAVDGATEDYREESDTVARFLKDCCIVAGEKYQMSSSLLYSEYKRYCEAEGETSLNQVDVRKRLVNLGHEWKRLTPGIFWKGISLKPCEEEQEGDSRQTAITQTPIGSNVYAFPTLPIDLERRTA
jgi:putative DNA primase/helicase